jgi:hypothetical protein
MSTTLSPSNLKIVDAYNDLTWAATYNENLVLLNSTLLKLSELLDVTKTGIANGKILVYSAATGKWTPITPTHRVKATGSKLSFI